MVSTREKMYESNAFIKKFLVQNGFKNLYLFPHLRFMKDYVFEDLAFDAIGWKEGEQFIYLFQFKTNEKPSKKILEAYRQCERKYLCKLRWITKFRGGKVIMYGGT